MPDGTQKSAGPSQSAESPEEKQKIINELAAEIATKKDKVESNTLKELARLRSEIEQENLLTKVI